MDRTKPARLPGAADYVVRCLQQLDVKHAFGMNGANIEDVFEAADRAGEPRTVVAKHEFSAVAMAHGYHLRSGGIGVVLTTSGGGAFNAVAPLAEALSSRIPLRAVIGQIPQAPRGENLFRRAHIGEGVVWPRIRPGRINMHTAEDELEGIEGLHRIENTPKDENLKRILEFRQARRA